MWEANDCLALVKILALFSVLESNLMIKLKHKYCPFCRKKITYLWQKGRGRTQFFCQSCMLIFDFRKLENLWAQNKKVAYIKVWYTRRAPFLQSWKIPPPSVAETCLNQNRKSITVYVQIVLSIALVQGIKIEPASQA